jgi:hypothetical protein
MVNKATNEIEYYIGRNYRITLFIDEENEGYMAHHPELRGCVTCGGDIHSVIENLNQTKKGMDHRRFGRRLSCSRADQ